MKKLIIALIVILACIVIVGGILIFMGMTSEETQQPSIPATSALQTEEETEPTTPETQETQPIETVVILPTEAETQEETTEETTAPTTQETQPEKEENILPSVNMENINGSVTGSGSFASNTGVQLDVNVQWQSFNDSDGSRKVRLDVYLNCRNLYVGQRYGGLVVKLGGSTKTLDTDAIEHTGSSASILIGSVIMDLPEGSVDCSVSWAFRGTYNDEKLDNITAHGTIS